MIDNIMDVFDNNIQRIRNLLNIYDGLSVAGKGRRAMHKLDVLRVAVVLTHATMEDYFRSIMHWKLPSSTDTVFLNTIPFDGDKTKFSLGDLRQKYSAAGVTIAEVISTSIKNWLNEESFNNTNDLSRALARLGFATTPEIKSLYPDLTEMIARRHHIVHQADRASDVGIGTAIRMKAITKNQVLRWKRAVDKLVLEVNKNFTRI